VSDYRNNPAVSGTEVVRAAQGCSVRQFHNREFSHPAQVSMRVGTYAHALIFEPDECGTRYAAPFEEPAGLPTNATQKRAWLIEREVACPAKLTASEVDALYTQHGGPSRDKLFADYARSVHGEIPYNDEWSRALQIRDAVLAHPTAAELLRGGTQAEGEYYWTDLATGIASKGKLDLEGGFRNLQCVITDLKTGQKKSPSEIARQMRYDKKWMQFEHYRRGLAAHGRNVDGIFIIGADLTGGDVEVCVCEFDIAAMESMARDYEKALRRADALKRMSPAFDGTDGFGTEIFPIYL
jgi:hypothetical protein